MNKRRSVLVVHSDSQRLQRLGTALSVDYDTWIAPTAQAALEVLGTRSVDVVVADSEVGTEAFLEEVERRVPEASRVVLSSDGMIERLISAMRKGHDFLALESSDRTGSIVVGIRALVSPRGIDRHRPFAELEVRLSRGPTAEPIALPLLDISNRGLSVHLGLGKSLEGFLPGTLFPQLSLWNQGAAVLSGVSAVIRHVRPLEKDQGVGTQRPASEKAPPSEGFDGYQIGFEFLSDPQQAPESPGEPVRNVVRRAALLREGLRRAGIVIQLADEASVTQIFKSGRVDLPTERFTLRGGGTEAFAPGDVCTGRFDLGGASYSFLTAIESVVAGPSAGENGSSGQLVFRVPKALKATRRRHSHRLRPSQEHPIQVEIAEPFGSWQVHRPVEELNAAGFSFPIDLTREVFPIGTILSQIQMQFPDGTAIPAKGRVRSLTPLPAAEHLGLKAPYKCGVELYGLTITQQIKIADAIINTGAPEVEDAASQTTFPELWAFLEKSGFLYPEKLEKLKPALPEIQNTIKTLLTRRNRLFKTLLVRKSEGIQGHLSAVRLYRETWCIQHLAALKQGQALFAARVLNLGLAEYFEQIPEMEWMKIYFRPNNKWPARVFGTFAHRLKAPALSDIRTFVYWVGPTTFEPVPVPSGVTLREPDPADLLEIERYFITHGRGVALKAEDLTSGGIQLGSVDALYKEFGLTRSRRILIAARGRVVLGFVLAEISSLGLNLSELTNTFAVHIIRGEGSTEIRRILIAAARQLYAAEGRPTCMALSELGESQDYATLGFATTKSYSVWTWHRSLIRQYYEYVLRLFSRARDEVATS